MADIGSLVGGIMPSAGNIGFFFKMLLWFLGLGGAVYLGYWFFSYKYRVVIYNPHRGGILENDKAMVKRNKKDKSIRTIQLFKNKEDFVGEVPEDHIVPVKKSFGRVNYMIHMMRDKTGAIYSIPPPGGEGFYFDPGINASSKQWAINKIIEATDRYSSNSLWLQYAPLIVSIAGILIVAVLMIVVSRDLGSVASSFSNAADAFHQAQTQVIS